MRGNMVRPIRRLLAASLLCLSCAFHKQAWAGDDLLPARTDVAGSRPQTEFDPLGVRIGTLIASPQLRVDSGYDTNLFGSKTAPTGDGYVLVAPSIALRSDWTLHGVNLGATGTLTRYISHARQRSNEYALHGGGHFDLGMLVVSGAASHSLISERHGVNGAPLSVGRPSQYKSTTQSMNASYDLAPLLLSLSASHEKIAYNDLQLSDGTVASQDFRDADQWSVEGKITYAPSDVAALAIRGRWQHARAKISARTNDKIEFAVSHSADVGMFRGAGTIGYLRQNFSNPQFRDFQGIVYQGQVSWYITPLLTISASGGRSLENSGVPTVGLVTTYSIGAHADYELMRNFIVTAEASDRRQYFSEIAQRTHMRSQEIKGEYRFNRTVAIGAYGRHECRDSSDTSQIRGFCGSLIGLSLTLKQ